MKDAADCSRGECLWFEQGCKIGCECSQDPDEPCAASMVPTITSSAALGYPGLEKYFPDTPWRAPGYAQIHDSCGLSGGGRFFHPENGDRQLQGIRKDFLVQKSMLQSLQSGRRARKHLSDGRSRPIMLVGTSIALLL